MTKTYCDKCKEEITNIYSGATLKVTDHHDRRETHDHVLCDKCTVELQEFMGL